MTKSKLAAMKLEDLKKSAEKIRGEVADAYLNMRMGKLNDVREPRKQRKQLATILTEIRNRQKNNLSKEEDAKDKADRKSTKK